MTVNVLLIACGALAREIVELTRLNNWDHLKIQCLPAELHNRPERIPAAVRAEIEDKRHDYEHIFVAYADCGTGGMLDKHPELMPQYFGNYKRLIYLAQSGSPDLDSMAEQHASYLDLDYERVYTDLEHMGHDISEKLIQWQN